MKLFIDIKEGKEFRRIKILLGLVSVRTYFWDYTSIVRFFGIQILKSKIKLCKEVYYFAGIPVFVKDLAQVIIKDIERRIDVEYDDAYYLSSRSGEAFLMMRYLEDYIKRQGSKKPVFVTSSRYHKDIAGMFFPGISVFILHPGIRALHRSKQNILKSKNHRFINLTNYYYFKRVEDNIQKKDNVHFYDELLRKLGADNNGGQTEPQVQKESIESAELKMRLLGLKFVVLSPESQSTEPIDGDFWNNLALKFYEQDYDVFFNIMRNSIKTQYGKTCFMKLDEARILVSKSAAVVGLRSGFLDVTADAAKKMCVLYTPFKKRGELKPISAQKILNAFSLKKLPGVNSENISEYCVSDYSVDELVDNILVKLEGCK